ncbi:MAG: hypothetical protein ACD_58C00335G0001 [uncultured bacterium]|nr:MAG: hypothetical protein ACD_58C00335G0001 [uncultured bacterium]
MDNKIRNFMDLNSWKLGHELVLNIYRVTKTFPKEELFGLTNQVRRAAVSITSNIAEGFSRNSLKEKIQFYFISLGSVTEVQNQIIIAKDLGYISDIEFGKMFDQCITVNKLLKGMIKSSKLKNYC